jgi:serine/threonine-protein kinase RsbT
VDRTAEWRLGAQEDVVTVRQAVRSYAVELGISLVDQTKLVTAVSELARNTVIHGGGGRVVLEKVDDGGKSGIRLTFEDRGPGIPDVNRALQDGFTTGSGLGLGLGGAKRLVHEFAIESQAGAGTKVIITQWKSRR